MMGGNESLDFLAPAGAGENTLVTCENGDFAADLEVARDDRATSRASRTRWLRPRRSRRRASRRARRSPSSCSIDVAATSKAMPVTTDDGTSCSRSIRGDDRIEPAKLDAALGVPVAARRPTRRSARRSAPSGGSLGPVGFKGDVVADETLREGQFVAGANRDGWHLRGVEAGRDFQAALRRPARVRRGRRLPELRRRAQLRDGDRGRPHLQARHQVLRAARCDVPRRGRAGAGADHGLLRHRARAHDGGDRRAAATTSTGSSGRRASPRTTSTWSSCRAPRRSGSPAAEALSAAGKDVLLDDRDQRPGEKFADADLIGIPMRDHRGQEEPRGRRASTSATGRPARSDV